MNNKINYPFMKGIIDLRTYVVKEGDSLYAIAQKYNVDINELQEVNKLATTMIYPNQVLFIPNGRNSSYITKSGDTLKMLCENLKIKLPSLNGYDSLLELELADNQQIDIENSLLMKYQGESIEEILNRNNISAIKLLELNKDKWLRNGTQLKIR